MKTYAAYRMDQAGGFKTGRWIDAPDEKSAAAQASFLFEADTFRIQLWSGSTRLRDLHPGARPGVS